MDLVIMEVNQFFQTSNFNKLIINGNENFEYKGEYFMLTKDERNYYLEWAQALDYAKKNVYEDMEAYSVKLYTPEKLIQIIKNDIMKYIVNAF